MSLVITDSSGDRIVHPASDSIARLGPQYTWCGNVTVTATTDAFSRLLSVSNQAGDTDYLSAFAFGTTWFFRTNTDGSPLRSELQEAEFLEGLGLTFLVITFQRGRADEMEGWWAHEGDNTLTKMTGAATTGGGNQPSSVDMEVYPGSYVILTTAAGCSFHDLAMWTRVLSIKEIWRQWQYGVHRTKGNIICSEYGLFGGDTEVQRDHSGHDNHATPTGTVRADHPISLIAKRNRRLAFEHRVKARPVLDPSIDHSAWIKIPDPVVMRPEVVSY